MGLFESNGEAEGMISFVIAGLLRLDIMVGRSQALAPILDFSKCSTVTCAYYIETELKSRN
jgi:hypothetical protein